MKALIKVGYACNENCTFCHTLDVRHIDGSAAEVHRKIVRAKELGHTMVVLSGGEATIRPELFEWAAHAAKLGMDVGLVTNGLLLAYPDVVERLLKLRLKYVYMSLHGATAKIHNALVRTQTFDQARKAMENLVGRGLDLTINCVVTRQNVEHLKPLVDLVLPYPDLTLKFSMVQPKGGGDKHFETLAPPIAHVAAKVHEAITHGLARVRETGAPGPAFTHDGLPFCLLPGLEGLYDDLKTDRYWTMVEIGEDDFFPVDDKAKVQPDSKCRTCALRGACPGLYRGYHEAFGDAELKPVTDRPRSNSFNYVFEQLVTDKAGDACPLLTTPLGITPWDRGRHLFVKNGPRLARFRTESRDFADVEIEETKHAHGQLYLDASRKDAPDDFARDLVQLRRSSLCEPCPERARCTGLFEPLFEDVFTRDDARVRALLGELHGDVLDLGCGEGPYEDVLAPLARAGRIRYTGIDPDPARIEHLRARWPWATLECTTGEALAEHPGRFDHVLVLRSWNHLSDPARVLGGLAKALRPGGRLVVVDNVAFGLARMPAHARRAEGSRAMLEHYRNDHAADAVPLLAAAGFSVLERHDVGPGTSNQWLLVCGTAAA